MSLGPMELVIILGIALLLFGPSRLPGLGRSLGDAIRGFKKGIDGEEEKKEAAELEQLKESTRSADPLAQKQADKTKTEL